MSDKFKMLNEMYIGKPDGEGPWDHDIVDHRPMQVASKLNSLVAQYRKFGVEVDYVSVSASVMASLMLSPNAKPTDGKPNELIYSRSDIDFNARLNCNLNDSQVRIHGK